MQSGEFRTSPFKVTRNISSFSQRSLCFCGLKVIYLTLLGTDNTERRG